MRVVSAPLVVTLLGIVATSGFVGFVPSVDGYSDSYTTDDTLVADTFGWSVAEAHAQATAAEIVGAVAGHVGRERPKQFVGSALSSTPGGPPTLYIKGPADEFIIALIKSASVPIMLKDKQPYSFDELDERSIAVHDAVREIGYAHVGTTFDITNNGRIEVIASFDSDLPTTAEEVIGRLPVDLQSDVMVQITKEEMHQLHTAFGGMRMTLNGSDWCTAGWSVRNVSGVTGVTSQSTPHCGRQDTIKHPGHGEHSLYFKADHWGSWGEVGWYTTPVAEPAQFYATTTDIRPVNSIEVIHEVSLGESVCFFSRVRGVRKCSTVYRAERHCDNAYRFVEMSTVISVGGDSGGGWSFNNRAWGSLHGWCEAGHNTMSFASYYPNAVGVVVLTQ